jgi:hypothetical protein
MMQDTSLAAYRSEVKPTLGDRQAAVMAALGDDSLTNTEIADRLGGQSTPSCRAQMNWRSSGASSTRKSGRAG